jgi:beta-phosphoglucomutase-like phosphatase (HAD superfamily)
VRAAHAAGAMAVMVPDMLPPTDELRALCVAVVRDLHDVRVMLR